MRFRHGCVWIFIFKVIGMYITPQLDWLSNFDIFSISSNLCDIKIVYKHVQRMMFEFRTVCHVIGIWIELSKNVSQNVWRWIIWDIIYVSFTNMCWSIEIVYFIHSSYKRCQNTGWSKNFHVSRYICMKYSLDR